MKKNLAIFGVAAIVGFPMLVHAENPIVEAMQTGGVNLVTLSDDVLEEVKGTGLISYRPMPSVTSGINRHYVSYKQFGDRRDYRSFTYLGNSHDTSNHHQRAEGAVVSQRVAGDEWFADMSGRSRGLNQISKQMVEYHYQLLNRQTGAPRETAFHDSHWNRPMTTFRW